MPRLSRAVSGGILHHITQRGNRREDVFFREEDHRVYLAWLKEYGGKHRVEILVVLFDDKPYLFCCRSRERRRFATGAETVAHALCAESGSGARLERVLKAEEYPWSSAAVHGGLIEDLLLSQRVDLKKQRPCGTEKFVKRLEKVAGRVLQYRPIRRSRKKKGSVPFCFPFCLPRIFG
jgi:hypothetical protein